MGARQFGALVETALEHDPVSRRLAARAERLAKRITDTLTIEKLLTFAGDRRREIEVIAGRRRA